MPVIIQCQSCRKTMSIPDQYIGQNVKCPGCGVAVKVALPPEPVPAVALTKYCRTCGSKVSEDDTICIKCGIPPKAGKTYCYHCGVKTRPKAVICTSCGKNLYGEVSYRNTFFGDGLSDHFSFRTFVAPTLIRVSYVLTIVLLTLLYSAIALAVVTSPQLSIDAKVICFVVALTAWFWLIIYSRLAHELLIVLFRIYEEIRDFTALEKSRERKE